MSHPRLARLALDASLLAMVLIWAGNYSLVKAVIEDIPALAFNGLRLVLASTLFGLGWGLARLVTRPVTTAGPLPVPPSSLTPITRQEWGLLIVLGLIGHCGYQIFFITGIDRTTVANSALISGCTPVLIALLSAAVGHERIARLHWIGATLSLAGVYLVAGRGAHVGGASLTGDLLILGSSGCWAVYTVFSRPLLARHSPLVVTGATMIVGTIAFVPIAWSSLARTDWASIPGSAVIATAASAILALNVAYLIWYTAVQRIGAARTSIFSNMVPPAAMVIAVLLLGERVEAIKWVGAAAVVGGVLLTRLARHRPARVNELPVET